VYGKHFLFVGYELSDPMYLAQARVTHGGVTAASRSAAAWLVVSYVWVEADTAFPEGEYLLTLTGTARSGQAVALSTQAKLDGAVAEDAVAQLRETQPDAWDPGTAVVMNGQPIVLHVD
jgi:hypothetical protein